jgi:chromosome segregation ATPase
MNDLATRLRTVHSHVLSLVQDRDRLNVKLNQIEEELREERRNTDVLKARITELERENEVLRAVKAAPAASHHAGSTERIDELVSEIDRCLALLNA